jgi:hypothetical protein
MLVMLSEYVHILYGKLELGLRPVGRPKLHVRFRDMLATGLPTEQLKMVVNGRLRADRLSEQDRQS